MVHPERNVIIGIEKRYRQAPRTETLGSERRDNNPYLPILRERGFSVDIPSVYTDESIYPDGTSFDSLTGLPIELGPIRDGLVNKFADSRRKGKIVATVSRDFDNLKYGNDQHGKPFGDAGIIHDTADLVASIEDLQLDGATIVVTRQTRAADESTAWLFDLTPKQLQEIKKFAEGSNRKKKHLELPKFTFSSSTGLVTTEDPEIKAKMADIANDQENTPMGRDYDIYELFHSKSDEKARMYKLAKDLDRLPSEEAKRARNVDEVIDIFTDNLSGTRIGKHLLRTSFLVIRDEAKLEILKKPISREEAMQSLQVPMDLGKSLTFEELRIMYYSQLLQSITNQVEREMKEIT